MDWIDFTVDLGGGLQLAGDYTTNGTHVSVRGGCGAKAAKLEDGEEPADVARALLRKLHEQDMAPAHRIPPPAIPPTTPATPATKGWLRT